MPISSRYPVHRTESFRTRLKMREARMNWQDVIDAVSDKALDNIRNKRGGTKPVGQVFSGLYRDVMDRIRMDLRDYGYSESPVTLGD